MIGYVSGIVLHKTPKSLLIKSGQIGFEVFTTARVIGTVQETQNIELYTHLQVREDILALYGFPDLPTLELFRQLISVSGVGPKTALEILSAISITEIREAVIKAHPESFAGIPGIGKKTASKIVLELQSKIGKERELNFREQPHKEEALEALINLGYHKTEALQALKNVDGELPAEEQLRQALRKIAK